MIEHDHKLPLATQARLLRIASSTLYQQPAPIFAADLAVMRRMGIEALYRRLRTSKPAPGRKIYPYLLRDVALMRPNQVWTGDITFMPMARSFV